MSAQKITFNQLQSFNATPPDQSYSGVTFSITYGEALVKGDPVYFDIDTSGALAAFKADANVSGKFPAVGIAVETAGSGTHVVLVLGVYRDDSLLDWPTSGGATLVYLSTSGGLTTTQPSATNDCIQVIGVAITKDILYVKPELVYLLHA